MSDQPLQHEPAAGHPLDELQLAEIKSDPRGWLLDQLQGGSEPTAGC